MTEDWTLQVRYAQRRDSGIYECQVGTTPPIGQSMVLSVVGKHFIYITDVRSNNEEKKEKSLFILFFTHKRYVYNRR